jgi:hypothetical protein
MEDEMNHQTTEMDRNRWRLPFGFFAGPVLWGLQILIGYGLATLACQSGNSWLVYLTTGLAALIVLIAGILVYQVWSRRSNDSLLMETDRAQDTRMFWEVSGLAVSTLFFFLILATAVAAIFLSPCPIITMPLP